LLHGIGDDALLQEVQRLALRIWLLLHRSDEQCVQLGMLRFRSSVQSPGNRDALPMPSPRRIE
jgi:hypothetical protein